MENLVSHERSWVNVSTDNLQVALQTLGYKAVASSRRNVGTLKICEPREEGFLDEESSAPSPTGRPKWIPETFMRMPEEKSDV
eukprot:2593457-Heterocapsa_arctica.AAC.1